MAAKTLRVCFWPEYYGISYRDPKTQQLSGIDTDMAIELARELAVEVQFVESSFARLVDDVLGDRCDIAMFGIGITPARERKLKFTRPHLASDIYAITTRLNRRIRSWSDIDRPGSVVAVVAGTIHEQVMKEKLQAARLRVVDTPFAREEEVQSGRADVFMTDYPYAQRLLARTDWARRVDPPGRFHVMPYAYVVQPGDERWHARVERFVAEVKRDGRLLAAARRHRLDAMVIP